MTAEAGRVYNADLSLCKCGHMAFQHRHNNGECEHCNAPINQPQACENGTCCHAFRSKA